MTVFTFNFNQKYIFECMFQVIFISSQNGTANLGRWSCAEILFGICQSNTCLITPSPLYLVDDCDLSGPSSLKMSKDMQAIVQFVFRLHNISSSWCGGGGGCYCHVFRLDVSAHLPVSCSPKQDEGAIVCPSARPEMQGGREVIQNDHYPCFSAASELP